MHSIQISILNLHTIVHHLGNMKCSINLINVSPEQLPALMSTLSALNISFHLHREQDDNDFSTPPLGKRLQEKRPISNSSMMCAYACCSKVGGFYNRECHPRVYYCAEHKPDATFKTHKTFTLESLRFGESTNLFRKRVRQGATGYDDDGWLESRNSLSSRLVSDA